MAPIFVDDLTQVGKRVAKTRDPVSKRLTESTVEKVAKVLVDASGREGIAVDLVKHKEDIVSVIVRYTNCAPGDTVAERCISTGEQRQHHPHELTVLAVEPEPVIETEEKKEEEK